jgi:dihydroorotate dehydrogenase (fumarate)
MLTSALLANGPGHLRAVHREMVEWLDGHGYGSVDELRGSASQATAGDPSAFERANYLATLHSWAAAPDLTPSSPSS